MMRDTRDDITFHYDPSREGLGQVLGDLELEVMEALWGAGESCVRDLLERLDREVAYTSVITVANRLAGKGLLARRKDGKTYFYEPRLTREELVDLATRRILDRVRDIAAPATVVNLMDEMIEEDPEALEALEKLIDARRRRKGASR